VSASVLAWVIIPPSIRHAHHGGSDRDHCHHAVAKHDPQLGHHHGHEESDHRQEIADIAAPVALDDFVVHLHWSLFGLDFCMPTPQEGERDEDRGACGLALVRLIDDLPAVIPGGRHCQGVPLVVPPEPGPRLVVVQISPSHPPNVIACIPLCDSARPERSGVLLV